MCKLALAFSHKCGSCMPIQNSVTNLCSFREMEVKNSTDGMKSEKSIADRRVEWKELMRVEDRESMWY